MEPIHVIDSHTEGEPTRVVVSGGPDLGGGSVAEQAQRFRERYDWIRSAVVNEPRGYDALVGALIVQSPNPRAACGVIFFNNVGLLNTCGHGTIGLAVTLAYLKRVGPGIHIIDTPVGEVTVELQSGNSVRLDNVASYRFRTGVVAEFEFEGQPRRVVGDVAWGGNWFFLATQHDQEIHPRRIEALTNFTWSIRQSLEKANIAGEKGALIDHIELFGPPARAGADSKNFVLCPGRAYDRSPCGTGTSAKLACLHADGKLRPGQWWGQESIIGSLFRASYRLENNQLIPTIIGSAFVTSDVRLLLDPNDPFRDGIQL